MSEQANDKYAFLRAHLPELVEEAARKGAINPRAKMIIDLLGDYDALHAEAEALREERDSFQREGIRAMEELEAARGLLREMDDYLSRRGDGEAIHTGSKFHMAIDAFLSSPPSPAQEVQAEPPILQDEAFADEFAKWWESDGQYVRSGGGDYERTFAFEAWRYLMPKLRAAEQGERQEVVACRRVLLMTSYCSDGGEHCTDECPCADCLSMCNVVAISGGRLEHVGQFDQLPGFNKLVLEETSRDVRGLVEALEHARLFIRNGVELGYVKMPDADTPDPAHDTLPKIEAALAAHRQGQRQA